MSVYNARGDWSLEAAPAANAQATQTQAAPIAGYTLKLSKLSFGSNIGSVAAAGPVARTLVVRSGATGVGAVKFQMTYESNGLANSAAAFDMELDLDMADGTACTVEFTNASGDAHIQDFLNASGVTLPSS